MTCGHLPLTASYHDVSRCIFTSIDLYEYQGSNSSSSSPNLWHFKWELKHSAVRSIIKFHFHFLILFFYLGIYVINILYLDFFFSVQKHLANFYISDKYTGTRFLVRAGESTQVAPFVKYRTIEISKDEGQISPNFLSWLEENNLSSNSPKLRIKEG